MTGISLPSGVANAAPPASRPRACSVAPVVRADRRRSADPAVPAVRAVTSAGPAVQAVRHPATSADPAAQAVRHPATSADPAGPTSAGPTTMTSADPTTTIGDHRGTQAITTGAVGSTVPHGVTDLPPWGWGAPPPPPWDGPLPEAWGPPPPPINYWGFKSNRCGIPATTNGASTSSGSGFRFRSDLPTGRPPRMHWGWPSSRSWGQFT